MPSKSSRDAKGKDQKEGLYDLKIGSWQNREDQDLETTKKQLAEIDLRQQINQRADCFQECGVGLLGRRLAPVSKRVFVALHNFERVDMR